MGKILAEGAKVAREVTQIRGQRSLARMEYIWNAQVRKNKDLLVVRESLEFSHI